MTKGSVAIGTYEVNKTEFDSGVAAFREGQFIVDREVFDRADSENRDAATQFYIAYSFYREGWVRVSNDDALFQSGLRTVNLVDPNFRSTDADLQMKTRAELTYELEGLKLTMSDLNPIKETKVTIHLSLFTNH